MPVGFCYGWKHFMILLQRHTWLGYILLKYTHSMSIGFDSAINGWPVVFVVYQGLIRTCSHPVALDEVGLNIASSLRLHPILSCVYTSRNEMSTYLWHWFAFLFNNLSKAEYILEGNIKSTKNLSYLWKTTRVSTQVKRCGTVLSEFNFFLHVVCSVLCPNFQGKRPKCA